MASFSSLRSDVFSRESRRQHYGSRIMGLNAYDRHKKFMDDYVYHYQKQAPQGAPKLLKTDMDTLRETYRFIRTEEDDEDRSWEQRLAKRYYDKLFKEYCITDMSLYKKNKIGLRWRSEKEVISGKGQFICGNKTCDEKEGLRSFEVNFAYKESGENRQALVKLRVCPRCAYKLNYRKEKELERQLDTKRRKRRKSARKSSRSPKRATVEKRSNEDSDSEDWSNSSSGRESDDAEDSEEKGTPPDSKTEGQRGTSPGKGTSISSDLQPQQKNPRNDEFEQFFEDMFL